MAERRNVTANIDRLVQAMMALAIVRALSGAGTATQDIAQIKQDVARVKEVVLRIDQNVEELWHLHERWERQYKVRLCEREEVRILEGFDVGAALVSYAATVSAGNATTGAALLVYGAVTGVEDAETAVELITQAQS